MDFDGAHRRRLAVRDREDFSERCINREKLIYQSLPKDPNILGFSSCLGGFFAVSLVSELFVARRLQAFSPTIFEDTSVYRDQSHTHHYLATGRNFSFCTARPLLARSYKNY